MPVRAVLRLAPCGARRRRSGSGSGLLSWGSFGVAPPPARMLCVHSGVSRSSPVGPEMPPSGLVPPLSFHPTPTVYSAPGLAGLLHPATGHGVRHVSSLPPRCRDAAPFPVALTLRSFSLPGSLPASPRFVPSRRCSRARRGLPRPCCHERFRLRFLRSLDLRALLHQGVRCKRSGVSTGRRSMLPWVFPLSSDASCPVVRAGRSLCTLPPPAEAVRSAPAW